jgi:hypothetical protein
MINMFFCLTLYLLLAITLLMLIVLSISDNTYKNIKHYKKDLNLCLEFCKYSYVFFDMCMLDCL